MLVVFFFLAFASVNALRVTCIGDSITSSYGPSDPRTWPSVLGRLLGPGHTVTNFGVSGTTMMKKGDHPYWETTEYQKALKSRPDIVIIQLGTNDAKVFQWNIDAFVTDYHDMISIFKPLAPRVVVSIPPPLYIDGVFKMNQTVINRILPPLIHEISATDVVDLVDVFDHMGTHELLHPAWFADGCHPSEQGYSILGETMFAHIRPF